METLSGRSNVLIISERQSSVSNKFYGRNQTLQADAISDVVRTDWPDWIYQFVVVNVIVTSTVYALLNVRGSLGAQERASSWRFLFYCNKEMRIVSRIRAHQSTSETFNMILWRRKTNQLLWTTSSSAVIAGPQRGRKKSIDPPEIFEWIPKVKLVWSICNYMSHRCRSWQIFGVAKEFCPNSPNFPEKNQTKVTSKKKSIRAPFFSNQSMLGAIFAQIFKEFVKVLRDFSQILWDFARIFIRLKLLGMRLHPLPPTPVTWAYKNNVANFTQEKPVSASYNLLTLSWI